MVRSAAALLMMQCMTIASRQEEGTEEGEVETAEGEIGLSSMLRRFSQKQVNNSSSNTNITGRADS